MRSSHAIFLWVLVCLSLLGFGVEGRGGPPPSANITASRMSELLAEVAGENSSSEQLWAYVQKWRAEKAKPYSPPASADRSEVQHGDLSSRTPVPDWLTVSAEQRIRICAASREFIRKFPADPRGWDARILILEDYAWGATSPEEYRALCEQIIAAPDAAAATRERASEFLVIQFQGKLWNNPEEAEKVFSAYEKDYPDGKFGEVLVRYRLRYYSQKKPEEVVPLLRQLVGSPNKKTAAAAERELALRTKPLDFKFTATNGRTVDLAKLRGKVVMLYFWATWGEPTRNILPKVLALRHKYGAGEFQVIGIALDDERSDMRRAIKTHKMDWPNVNDTLPGQGRSPIALRFGDASPQTVWLLDREGVAKELLPGADLDSEIRKRLEKLEP